jgi:hypothetical protein
MFSGGDYHEVARWLGNFLASHAKREHPRVEVALDAAGEREGKSYAATLTLGERSTSALELEFAEVAGNREGLAWCHALAARTRTLVRERLLDPGLAHARLR